MKTTLKSIERDLNNGDTDCLYFATEEQIYKLIDAGRIDEDYASHYQMYQEEMRCMIGEAAAEYDAACE